MLTVVVDGTRETLEFPPETLGELLARVDAGVPPGRIVTALRIDGVDEPAFREPSILARPLAWTVCVEVESGTPAQLAARCLAETAVALDALAAAASATATDLRQGQIVRGNQTLAALTEGVSTAVAITGAAALGISNQAAWCESLNSAVAGLGPHLDALIAAQQAGDWTGAANVLELRFIGAMHAWREALNGGLA